MENDAMLLRYAHHTALKLVYNLAKNDADREVYETAKDVLSAALDALDAGYDPAEHIDCINGQICEV